MAGTKVSELNAASSISNTDLFYIVNNGSPRNISISALSDFVKTHTNLINNINDITTTNNSITITSNTVGLGNVPNVNPVTSVNALHGNLNITGNTSQINVITSNTSNSITIAIDSNFTIPFSKISGAWEDNASLLSGLASVGAEMAPRTVNSSSNSYSLVLSDLNLLWINADFMSNTELTISSINAPVGALLEVRQAGSGQVTVINGDANTLINYPYGTWSWTNGVGTRIQLVSLGANAWEYK